GRQLRARGGRRFTRSSVVVAVFSRRQRGGGRSGLWRRDEEIDHLPAAGKAILRDLRKRPFDHTSIVWRQRGQTRRALQVLRGELRGGLAGKWQHAGQHFLVDDGEAVLIAILAGAIVE